MTVPSHSQAPSVAATCSLEVRTGSRLHFGLFAFGRSGGQQYGGVGLMIQSPAVRIRFSQANEFQLADQQQHLAETLKSWLRYHQHDQSPACRIEVVEYTAQHIGLGSGTQLSCAVAAGLSAWVAEPIDSAARLAGASGRGVRSAIGTHGFLQGGLIVDGGKRDDQPLGSLLARTAFPEQWKILLIWPRQIAPSTKVSGQREQHAFGHMPAVTVQREEQLRDIAMRQLLPAVEQLDFDRFCQAVHEYNQLAGECYRTVQDGAYANAAVAQLIGTLRSWGVLGVGQSSWGPLVFAFAENQAQADRLQQRILTEYHAAEVHCQITSARNTGARIELR